MDSADMKNMAAQLRKADRIINTLRLQLDLSKPLNVKLLDALQSVWMSLACIYINESVGKEVEPLTSPLPPGKDVSA